MFQKRKFVTAVSVEMVLLRIKGQVRNSFPLDRVDGNTFSIHKSVTNSPRGDKRFIDFLFKGSVHKVDGQTEIVYRVRVPMILTVLWSILAMFVVWSVIDVLMFNGSVFTLIISFLLPVASCGFVAWECRECVNDFEARLE